MNKIMITLAALLTWCVGNAHAENIGISDVTINAGASKTVELTLPQVSSGVAGFQFDVEIPQQVTVVGDDASQQFRFDSYLSDNFTISVNEQGSNSYRIMAYSPSVSMVKLNGSEKISFVLKADKKAVEGSYVVKVKDIVLSDENGVVTKLQDNSGNVTIAAPVRVVANNKVCVYGDSYGELSYDISSCYTTGTPSISCEATQASHAGVYDIIVGKGTLDTDTVTLVNGTLTITKAPLKITAKNYTIKQGEALPAFEADYEGFKNGDTPANLVSGPSFTTTAVEGCNPGEYTINVSGAESSNYNISYVNGLLTVTNADAIIIRARSYSRQYGEENPTFGYDVDGSELIGTPEISCNATAASAAGTYDIVISKGSVSNFNDTYVNGTLTITKAQLTIKAKSYTITQGEEFPDFEADYEGFKNGENSKVLTKMPVLTSTAYSTKEPGTYDIIASSAEAENYEISYVKGTLTIKEAEPVKVTAKSYTIEYGESIPAFEYTSEGAALSGVPEIRCSATSASAAGTYDIVVSKGSVSNFNDTYVNGTLTITKAPLVISVGEYTRPEGEENPEFELTYEGFKNGESDGVLTRRPVVTCIATKDSEPGEYVITIDGAEAENYDIRYAPGKLTVTAKETGIRNVNGNGNVNGNDNGNDDAYYTLDGKKLDTAPKKGGLYVRKGRLSIKR